MVRNKHNTPGHYEVSLLADDVSESGGCVCLYELQGGLCAKGDWGAINLY